MSVVEALTAELDRAMREHARAPFPVLRRYIENVARAIVDERRKEQEERRG